MYKIFHRPIFICCFLSAILWIVIFGIDALSGEKIWITRSEVNKLENDGLIVSASRLGNEFIINFTQTVNLRRGNSKHAVDSVFVKAVDVSDNLRLHWIDDKRYKERTVNTRYFGGDFIIIICFLTGISFAVISGFRNAREGSPRYKIKEIEKKYLNGELTEQEFKSQIDELSPYL